MTLNWELAKAAFGQRLEGLGSLGKPGSRQRKVMLGDPGCMGRY